MALLCALLLCGWMLGAQAVTGSPVAHGAIPDAKKHCKTVKKHGKTVKVCKTVKPTPKPKATSTPTVVPTPTAPALSTGGSPINVGVHTDDAHAVTQTIPTTGGSISATAADGIKYTLTIPDKALLDTTAITMKPITSMDNLPPDAKLVGAVRLAPEGLRLLSPATFTISLPSSVDVAKQLAFNAHGDGSDFHLYPQSYDPTTVTLQILHFSDPGLSTGTQTTVQYTLQHPPAGLEAQREELTAVIQKSQKDGTVAPAEVLTRLSKLYSDAYEQVILPNMQTAATTDSESVAQAATNDALSWMRAVALLGLDKDAGFKSRVDILWDLIDKTAQHQYTLAKLNCGAHTRSLINDQTFGWIIDQEGAKEIIAWQRTAALLGLAGAFNEDLNTALKNCRPLGFKTSQSVTLHWHYDSTVANPILSDYTKTQDSDETLGPARLCAHDLAGTWVGSNTIHYHSVAYNGRTSDITNTGQWTMTVKQDGSLTAHSQMAGTGHISISPVMQATITFDAGVYGTLVYMPQQQTVTIPFEEDMSCPNR
jgi:hypothetical protein